MASMFPKIELEKDLESSEQNRSLKNNVEKDPNNKQTLNSTKIQEKEKPRSIENSEVKNTNKIPQKKNSTIQWKKF